MHRPLDLLLFRTNDQNDTIESTIAASLYQYRRFGDADSVWIALLSLGEELFFAADDGRMDDAVQGLQFRRIVKNKRGQSPPVDSPVWIEDLPSESRNYGIVRVAIRHQDLVTDFISSYDVTSERFQRAADKGLATRKSPCEPDFRHIRWCASAAAMVFAISMATVSTPTPPGTGV